MSDDEGVERYQVRDASEGWAGRALIINVLHKSSDDKEKRRDGSNLDVQKMKEVFEHLNLEVENTQSDDPTAQQIRDEVIRFREKLKNEYKGREKDFDMIAVCLMGHGMEGVIFGSDDQKDKVDLRADVFQAFSNEKCDVLSGKPRIFFTQACRGEKRDFGINGQSTLKRQVLSMHLIPTKIIFRDISI